VVKGMSQYISRKSDAKSKPPTQVLKPNVWTVIEASGKMPLVPTESSKTGAFWSAYLNIETPRVGGATELVIRWMRDPAGIKDITGMETKSLNKGGTTFVKDTWMFQAIKGQPVVFMVKANGKATVTTRETKLAIP
jgi:hypothetical protein